VELIDSLHKTRAVALLQIDPRHSTSNGLLYAQFLKCFWFEIKIASAKSNRFIY